MTKTKNPTAKSQQRTKRKRDPRRLGQPAGALLQVKAKRRQPPWPRDESNDVCHLIYRTLEKLGYGSADEIAGGAGEFEFEFWFHETNSRKASKLVRDTVRENAPRWLRAVKITEC